MDRGDGSGFSEERKRGRARLWLISSDSSTVGPALVQTAAGCCQLPVPHIAIIVLDRSVPPIHSLRCFFIYLFIFWPSNSTNPLKRQGKETLASDFLHLCNHNDFLFCGEDFPHSAECSWSGRYSEGSKRFKDSSSWIPGRKACHFCYKFCCKFMKCNVRIIRKNVMEYKST